MVTPAEQIILDPGEVDPNRTELDMTHVLDVSGVDWGEAGIVSQTVDTKWGEQQISYRIPGRQVVMPFVLKDVPEQAIDFDTIRNQLLAKFAMWQTEGGSIKRVLNDGRVLFLDCYGGTFTPGDQWMQAHRLAEPNAKVVVTAQPDFYSEEEEITFSVDAKGTCLLDPIAGDYPARSRIVVSDTSGNAQRGLLVALRSRYRSASADAAVRYEAEAMNALGTAASFAVAGSSGGSVMRRTDVGTSWTDMLDTRRGGVDLTHQGAYRVFARVWTNDTGIAEVRFQWGLGDMTLVETNEAKTIPVASGFALMDLGQVFVYPVPIGTHKWRGKVQAKASAAAKTFYVDELWFANVDEGWTYVETETGGDAVLTANGTAELRWDGAYKAASRYGKLPDALGDALRLPAGGLEARQVEMLVRGTRGRVDAEADAGLDIAHIDHIYVRPCWVQVPE